MSLEMPVPDRGDDHSPTTHEVIRKKLKPTLSELVRPAKARSAIKSSHIFTPFRTIGYITNTLPCHVQQRGREGYVTTIVGRAFQTFDCKTLNVVFVAEDAGGPISAITANKNLVFAAVHDEVKVYTRGKMVGNLKCTLSRSNIIKLDCLGDYLLALTTGNAVEIWNSEDKSHVHRLELVNHNSKAVCLLHPTTYLNKILIAFDDGALQLWNIRTSSMIYAFRPRETSLRATNDAITCVVQSPVVDVVAIGYVDGTILLFNLRLDTILIQLTQKAKVTDIAFRTDGKSLLAAANDLGDIVVWDLDEDRLMTTMKGAHESAIPSLHWLVDSEILLSSGADNAIKEWIFDGPDGVARLLKQRSGHYAAPNIVEYYGSSGHQIISASSDRSIRIHSIYRDSQSSEMSQNAVAAAGVNTNLTKKSRLLELRPFDLKLREVASKKSLAFSSTREKDWGNMITMHVGENYARVWSTQKRAITKMMLRSTVRIRKKSKEMEEASGTTTCVSMTFCGNFALLGSDAGRVDLYNVQSGFHRRVYDLPRSGDKLELVGVAADFLNRFIIGCTSSGLVAIWSFRDGKLLHSTDVGFRLQNAKMLEDSLLLVLITTEGTIAFFDVETLQTVRKFVIKSSKITDFTLSNDGRWLTVATNDALVRTFDIPTGYLIDAFRLPSAALSISLSPSGDFLATTHADSLGISLWANKAQFGPPPTRNITEEEIVLLALPNLTDEAYAASETITEAADEVDMEQSPQDEIDQINARMLTLSTAPRSKWETLLNLEIIRARNRPIEPPKVPAQAPFFLPAVSTGKRQDTSTALPKEGDDSYQTHNSSSGQSKIGSSMTRFSLKSDLWNLLSQASGNDHYETFFHCLRGMTPAALDLEIRSMPLDDDFETLHGYLRALTSRLGSGLEFEALQAYCALLFRVHGDLIVEHSLFLAALENLRGVQAEATARFQGLLDHNLAMINLTRGAPN